MTQTGRGQLLKKNTLYAIIDGVLEEVKVAETLEAEPAGGQNPSGLLATSRKIRGFSIELEWHEELEKLLDPYKEFKEKMKIAAGVKNARTKEGAGFQRHISGNTKKHKKRGRAGSC